MAMLMGKDSTIKKFIQNFQNDTVTIDKLQIKNIEVYENRKLILPWEDILKKYRGDLESHIQTITMTDQQQRRWMYNPKVMSYDLYGTTELWFTIVQLNEVYSTTQLNMNPIKAYSASILKVLSRIYALEKPLLDENMDEIVKGMLS